MAKRLAWRLRTIMAAALALAALALCLALPAQAHAAIENPFEVKGGAENTDWSYGAYDGHEDVLLVKTATSLTISMKQGTSSSTTAVIHVEARSANVTLESVKIDCSKTGGRSDVAPFSISSGTYLTLTLAGGNVLTAGGGKAGLDASGSITSGVTIEGEGSLAATGGSDGGAGIGSNAGTAMQGTITINGGTVTATGGVGAAGIGSAVDGDLNAFMYINGGTVKATGGTTGSGRGGAGYGVGAGGKFSQNNLEISISGGTVEAIGGTGAAGIGMGLEATNSSDRKHSIRIAGGTIKVTPGEGSVGIGGGKDNIFVCGLYDDPRYGRSYGAITVDNASIAITNGNDVFYTGYTGEDPKVRYSIIGGRFGEGSVDDQTVYGIKPVPASKYTTEKVEVAYDENGGDFPYCVVRSGYLLLNQNSGSWKYNADPYPAKYESGQGVVFIANYRENGGSDDLDKVTYRHRASGSTDDNAWKDGRPVDVGVWQVEATLPASSEPGEPRYFANTLTMPEAVTVNPLELAASGTSSLTATLPSVAVGVSETQQDVEITLSGGNIYDRDNPDGNSFKATATVTYPSTDATGDKTDATVKITKISNGNYSLPAGGIELTSQAYTVVNKQTPALDDFKVELPTNAVYDGTEHKATVSAASGVTGMGTVTMHYTKDGVTSDDAPKDAGTYQVTFDVAEGTAYGATTTPLNAGTFTIAKRTLSADVAAALPDVLAGSDATVAGTQIALSGGNILAADAPLAATATVERPSTATVGTHADATVSDVVLSNDAAVNYAVSPGYTLSNQAYKVLDKKTPQLSDFDVELPTNVVYDGAAHAATASAASGVTGMGTATVRYTKGDVTSTTAPVDAGTYQVTLDVAAGSSYEAGSVDAGSFTVAQRELDGSEIATLPSVVTGTQETQNTPIVLTGGAIVSGQTVTATATVTHPSGSSAGDQGDAEVSKVVLTNSSNYAVPSDYALSSQSYRVSDKPVPSIDDFTVTPFSGEYDGIGHKAAIAPKDGIGAVQNVRYLKDGTAVDGEPTDAGSYTLVFDVAESDAYAAESNLIVPDAVVVEPRILDATSIVALDDVAQGTSEARNLTVTLSGGRILGGELSAVASTVSYPSAGTPGPHADATVTLSSLVNAPNYALPSAGLALAGQAYFVVSTAPVYAIVEGADGIWNGDSQTGLRFRADGDLDKFTGVRVDGVLQDAANYTAESGSTVITLAPAYLATLKAGEHTLLVEFTDGSAETTFTVKAASEPEQKPGGTGEGSGGNGAGTGEGGSAAKPLAPTGDPLALVLGGAAVAAVLAGGALALARRRG